MRATVYNRRRSEPGHQPQPRPRFQVLRRALRLVPVTESLRALSHWRRTRNARTS